MYKFLKIFFCVFILFITPIALSCPESFQDLKISTIQEIFSDPVNYERYGGQNGYISFVKKVPNTNSMNYVFQKVSKALGKKFKRLKWQQFQGSVLEYKNLIQLFSKYPPEYFQGIERQKRVTKEIFEGHNRRTYTNVSVLKEMLLGSREAFTDLEWSPDL